MIPGIPSLADRTRSLLRQLLAMGQTRLEMLGLAVEQEVRALSQQLRLAAVCIIAAWLAGTCLVLLAFLVFPRQVALWVLGVLCVLFAITSLVSWRMLQQTSKRERLFTSLARQLRLDAQALESLTEGDEHG
jgi:uncharacterized membrane protein YqjE